MCGRDRSQITPLSQTNSLQCIEEVINLLMYPVCVRDNSGNFIMMNNSFETEFIHNDSNIELWFENLPIEVSLLLSQNELESFLKMDSLLSIDPVCIHNHNWSICFQVLSCKKCIYSVWHFYRKILTNPNIKGKLFPYKNIDSNLYDYRDSRSLLQWNALNLHLAGFSHHMISKLLSISVGSSKNYTADAHDFFKTSSRDEIIISIYTNGIYQSVFKNVEYIVRSNVNKLLLN